MMGHLSKMNMTKCYEHSCYEQPEYDSDYDSEYDSDDERSTRKRMVLGPVQLAHKKCKCLRCNWNGEDKECEQKWVTFSQMQAHYEEQLKLKCSELQVKTSTSIAKMQAEHTAALKEVEEQSTLVLSQHIAFMATLPKESKAGRERREAEKKKAHQEKLSRQVHKAGGFKKRGVKETDPEVIKARRAARRKASRDTKKEAETQRALTFASEEKVDNDVLGNDVAEKVDEVEEKVDNEVLGNDVAEEVEEEVEEKVEEVLGNEVVKEVLEEVLVVKKVVAAVEDNWQEVKPRKKQLSLQPEKQVTLRTQMCESVALNKACRHGGKCRFAHSLAELMFAECSFGNNCNNVKRTESGVYSSVCGKSCIRLHPGETKKSVCARVGIIIPKVVTKSVPFSSVYMPALSGAKSVQQITTSSAWQKQIKIQPDSTTLATKPVKAVEHDSTTLATKPVVKAPEAKKVDSTFLNTRMCDSVATKKPCRHGDKCRFAHSFSELVFPNCLFGESCRHVEYHNGVYYNISGRTCDRLHPGETNASVCVRSGLVKQAPVVPMVKQAPPLLPAVPMVKQAPVAPAVKQVPVAPVVKQEKKVTFEDEPLFKMPTPAALIEEETVIRVPKEFVIQAMELAMKSGKTNIRVEIV